MEVPEVGEVHLENESDNEQPHVVNGEQSETETESKDDQGVPQNVPENEPSSESEDEQVPQIEPEDDQVVPQIEQEGDQVVPQIQPEGEQVALQDNVQVMKEISEDDWNRMLKKTVFTKEDMNMLVMDFLVGKELPTVAQAFHAESGCPRITDLSVLETQKTVRNLIMSNQFDEAISLINVTQSTVYFSYWPRLKFYLEQQKMIELCRRRDFTAALKYSRKFIEWYNFKGLLFAPDDFKKESRRTLLLMLYGDNAESPVADLFDPMRKSYIATYVVDKIIEYNGRKTGNGVERAMKMLIANECWLNQVVKFPNFNTESGFPESLS